MILRQLWCGIFLRQIAGLCVFSGCRWRTRTLCIRQTLCRRDNWYSDSDFCCFDCLLTVSDDWYTVGIVLVDLWRLVHQWLFLLLTVFDDWYTVGTVLVDLWRLVQQRWFLLFWLFLTITGYIQNTNDLSLTTAVSIVVMTSVKVEVMWSHRFVCPSVCSARLSFCVEQ